MSGDEGTVPNGHPFEASERKRIREMMHGYFGNGEVGMVDIVRQNRKYITEIKGEFASVKRWLMGILTALLLTWLISLLFERSATPPPQQVIVHGEEAIPVTPKTHP